MAPNSRSLGSPGGRRAKEGRTCASRTPPPFLPRGDREQLETAVWMGGREQAARAVLEGVCGILSHTLERGKQKESLLRFEG